MSKLQIPEWEKRKRRVVWEDAEEIPAVSPVKVAACEVVCGMHLLAFLAFVCIFVNTDFSIPTLLFALYCAFGAFWFGCKASYLGGINER